MNLTDSLDGDQPVVKPVPAQENTSTERKYTYIYVSNVIRTHDPTVPATKSFRTLDRMVTAVGFQ
jgi:hypothetical protein